MMDRLKARGNVHYEEHTMVNSLTCKAMMINNHGWMGNCASGERLYVMLCSEIWTCCDVFDLVCCGNGGIVQG